MNNDILIINQDSTKVTVDTQKSHIIPHLKKLGVTLHYRPVLFRHKEHGWISFFLSRPHGFGCDDKIADYVRTTLNRVYISWQEWNLNEY